VVFVEVGFTIDIKPGRHVDLDRAMPSLGQ
jgi:hypothetical protein